MINMNMDALWAGKTINGWYIGFEKVTMHVKKKKQLEKKMLGKKFIQIYSMFCIIKT